jgi:CRP/FNR family transcriptional regulator
MLTEPYRNPESFTQLWSNFINLSESQLEQIRQTSYIATFKSREVIFKQGTPTSNAIILISGIAKVHIEGNQGKQIILNIIKPNRLILGPGSFVDNKNYYSLTTLTESKACFLDLSVLKSLINENNKFAEGYIRFINQKSIKIFNKLVSSNQKNMYGRLAEGLIFLSEEIFMSDKFGNVLSRQELGELTNMTKESVVRILKKFQNEQLIHMEHDSIQILNRAALKELIKI